jgi:ABC-type amino acid transport substrate-binding protein
VAFRLSEEDRYGIAIRKGSDLREHLNRFLVKMKESGRLEEILERNLR